METLNIRMRRKNESGEWDTLYPETRLENVIDSNGKNVKEIVGEINQSIQAVSKKADTASQGIEQINASKMYRMCISSTNGAFFSDDNSQTTLSASVYSWDNDITDTLSSNSFVWSRKSGNSIEDIAWGNKAAKGKQITITKDDIRNNNSTFFCTVTGKNVQAQFSIANVVAGTSSNTQTGGSVVVQGTGVALNGYLSANMTRIQVLNTAEVTYLPDWTQTNLVLTPVLYKSGTTGNIMSDASITSVKWFKNSEEITGGEDSGFVIGGAGEGHSLTINKNIPDSEFGYDVRCEVTYTDSETSVKTVIPMIAPVNMISGAGGGSGAIIGTLTSEFNKTSCNTDEEVEIDYFFSSPNLGKATLYVLVDGAEKVKSEIQQGKGKVNLGLLQKGSRKIDMYVIDKAGVFTNQLSWNLQVGSLELTSSFNQDKDYSLDSLIRFAYNVDTISKDAIKLHIFIDEKEYTASAVKGYNEYNFPQMTIGVHKIRLYLTSGDFVSNTLNYSIIISDAESLFVSCPLEQTEFEEKTQINIPYRISMKNQNKFNVVLSIDGQEYKRLQCSVGTNYWNISTLSLGSHTLKIAASTLNGENTAFTEVTINIVESSYDSIEPVTQGLWCWYDATDLSNNDENKEQWKDKSGNNIKATLHNFNYATNGWIDNALVCNGRSYVKIEKKAFADNAEYGLTFDILYEAKDVGDMDARVVDCTGDGSVPTGLYIDTLDAYLLSKENKLKTAYSEGEKTRMTFVIDRDGKYAQLYVNGVFCEVIMLSDAGTGSNRTYENFMHEEYIYLNSKKGVEHFGDCKIYSLRVYGRALNHEEILQNHLADIKDLEEQKIKYDINFNNTLPTMYMYGDTTSMTKDNRVLMRIKYLSQDGYGESFDLDQCEVQWQGTSSLQYAVKNYKIRLYSEYTDKKNNVKFKYNPFNTGVPENTFTLKADYMESSHANNTGVAKIVNQLLYEEPLPPQKDDPNVIAAINGFPIQLYINDELIGVFNFNNDKGNEASFGFKGYDDCLSYEVKANSDTSAGAFNKWLPGMTEVNEAGETVPISRDKYLENDFELRYAPDEDNQGWDEINRIVEWVSDATDEEFKAHLHEYFNVHYLIRYYLQVMLFGAVDNLGKNMMLCTWDRQIWYPCFYDNDTTLGLDNTGYLKFDSDIEMESGKFNTSSSKLWVKLIRNFDKEIKDNYTAMRMGKYRYENIMDILIGQQIDMIPERAYNLDAYSKYMAFGKTYLHMLHGSRREHMKRWVRERLLYLDTLYGYEEQWKDSITIRANKQGAVELNLQVYSPQYVKVKWRNGEFQTRKIGRGETVKFNSTIPTATDQEILIYNAPFIKDIGDISQLNPNSVDLGNATKLTKFICHSPNLMKVDVSTNPLLQEIDVTNSTALGTASGGANILDVSECTGLRTIKASGTSITGIRTNPDGGNLEEIYYPYTIQSIDIRNQTNLTALYIPWWGTPTINQTSEYFGSSALSQLTLINCPNVTKLSWNDEYENSDMTQLLGLVDVGSIKIVNSFLSAEKLVFRFMPQLSELTLTDLPNLKHLVFAENSLYNGGNNGGRLGNPTITNCPIETIEFKNYAEYGYQIFNFDVNTVLDFTKLTTLKKIIAKEAPMGRAKKLLLPSSIEYLDFNYTSPALKDIWLGTNKTHASDGFTGIDLTGADRVYDFNMRGLVGVEKIHNLNIKCTTLLPNFNAYRDGEVYKWLKPTGRVDLSEYTGDNIDYLFKNCDLSKLNITLPSNLSKIKSAQFAFANTDAGNEMVSDIKKFTSLTKCSYMFAGCENMTEVPAIPDNVENCESMFNGCSNLVSVESLPAKATNVSYMFQDCTSLVNPPTIGESAQNCISMFQGCTKLKTAPVIPNGVKYCDNMFNECSSLTAAPEIPSSALSTGYMFYNCGKLKTVPTKIPDSVSNCNYMFTGCYEITQTPQLPSKLGEAQGMFQGCSNITQAPQIPSGVRDTSYMFFYCSKLSAAVNIPNTVMDCSYMYQGCYKITEGINLPDSVVNCYSMYSDCSELVTPGTLGRNVVNTTGMYSGCRKLTSVPTMPETVQNCGNMYQSCAEITSVPNVSEAATEIFALFSGCSKLQTIGTLNFDNIATTPVNLFYRCTELREVNVKGTIRFELNLSENTQLSKATLKKFINALEDRRNEESVQKLTLGSENIGKLDEGDILAATQKNWTIA